MGLEDFERELEEDQQKVREVLGDMNLGIHEEQFKKLVKAEETENSVKVEFMGGTMADEIMNMMVGISKYKNKKVETLFSGHKVTVEP